MSLSPPTPSQVACRHCSAFDLPTRLKCALRVCPSSPQVGIYSVNCPEWVLVDAALVRQGVVSVPLYDTLGATHRHPGPSPPPAAVKSGRDAVALA